MGCDAGRLGEEAILVHVDAASQRVGTTAVAPQGSLIAGLSQWVGVSVVSKHDEIREASIVISGLGAQEAAAIESSTVPLQLQLKETSYIAKLETRPGKELAAGLVLFICPGPHPSILIGYRLNDGQRMLAMGLVFKFELLSLARMLILYSLLTDDSHWRICLLNEKFGS